MLRIIRVDMFGQGRLGGSCCRPQKRDCVRGLEICHLMPALSEQSIGRQPRIRSPNLDLIFDLGIYREGERQKRFIIRNLIGSPRRASLRERPALCESVCIVNNEVGVSCGVLKMRL